MQLIAALSRMEEPALESPGWKLLGWLRHAAVGDHALNKIRKIRDGSYFLSWSVNNRTVPIFPSRIDIPSNRLRHAIFEMDKQKRLVITQVEAVLIVCALRRIGDHHRHAGGLRDIPEEPFRLRLRRPC